MTYSLLKPHSSTKASSTTSKTGTADEQTTATCSCKQCNIKYGPVESRKKTAAAAAAVRRRAGHRFPIYRWLFVIAGWAIFAFFIYKIKNLQVENKLWDPYQILGIKTSSTEKEIKKHYKRLSLKFHPDKVKATLNSTKEEIAQKFVELTKAYKALTDEEVRRNYEEYGHPDGKQEFSMSIALPTWIIEAKNNYYVLGVYGLVFGLLLPYFVQKWWYGSRMLTKDGIRNETAGHYFIKLKEYMKFPQLLEVFSASYENKLDIPERSTDDVAIQKVSAQARGELFQRQGIRLEYSKTYSATWCRKSLALLEAHLLRTEVKDSNLAKDQQVVLTKSILLQNALLQMALARNWLTTSLLAMSLSQYIHQAVWSGDSELLQLPNVTPEVIKGINKGRRRRITDLAGLMELDEQERRNALRILSDQEYNQAINIAKQFPKLDVPNAFFKVLGEKVITPGALVTFVMKLRLLHPGQKVPKVPAKALEEVLDEQEHDHSVPGHKHDHDHDHNEQKKTVEHLVHSPYLVVDESAIDDPRGLPAISPQWWITLGDVKMNRVIVPPIKVAVDVPFAEVDDDEDSIKTVRIQFQAPPQAGLYTFVVFFKCDSYVGSDFKREIKLKIEDPATLEGQEDVEDDISEPDEDTIAGQMQSMRGGATKKAKGSDDESEDDEEDEESSSEEDEDTDTDTSDSDSD